MYHLTHLVSEMKDAEDDNYICHHFDIHDNFAIYYLETQFDLCIVVLVDTNMWYHSTYIHPGEVSITIGSEYD